MSNPKLVIRKRMQFIQGKVRACCYVQAMVNPQLQGILEEHFVNEALFKRAAYSTSWPNGALAIPPELAPHVSTFLKNDACPEITVKTMLAGQMFQGANAWEMMCFEFISKLAFDNFAGLVRAVDELDRDIVFHGSAMRGIDEASEDAVQRLEQMAAEMAA